MSADQPGFFRRHAARFVGSIVLLVCVVWAARHSGLELLPPWSRFHDVRWWAAPLYLVLIAVWTWFRSVRWRFLLRRVAPDVPKKRLLAISVVGFAAILLLPFRLGEFVRPGLLREKGKVSFSAATGSIIAERIVDGVFLSVVLAIALLVVPTVHPLPEHVVGLPVSVAQTRAYAFIVAACFLSGLVVLVIFYFARDFAKRATLAVFGIVSRPLAEKLAAEAEKLADGFHFFSDYRAAAGFLFETTLYWGFNALSMLVLAWGCGLVHGDGSAATFWEACALMGMLGVAILIPGPPGMLGVFQAGLFAGMTMYYPEEIVRDRGAVYACLSFLIQVFWQLAAGGVGMLSGHTSFKELAVEDAPKAELAND
ncbi:MAG TPA: lysylphosphatidylglycerol synthase transmembrane domain-containing protein [Polyangiaceae bacterium]|jgi:hypothetical protein